MDPAGLSILFKELQADSLVAGDAGRNAALRLRQESPGYLEARRNRRRDSPGRANAYLPRPL
jgi:hypothetical protein